MGVIADTFAAYAVPLLNQTDGSAEQVNTAFVFAQLCWNLAITPKEQRVETLNAVRRALKMDEADFDGFERSIIVPMIQRHQEMFPRMHRSGSTGTDSRSKSAPSTASTSADRLPKAGRNAPCPCNSGKKYKRCCGR